MLNGSPVSISTNCVILLLVHFGVSLPLVSIPVWWHSHEQPLKFDNSEHFFTSNYKIDH